MKKPVAGHIKARLINRRRIIGGRRSYGGIRNHAFNQFAEIR